MLKTLIRLRTNYKICGSIANYSNTLNLEEIEGSSDPSTEEEIKLKEHEIMKKRNKSRLTVVHQNFVNDRLPYNQPHHWSHGTLKYNRRMYGKFGKSSNFNPSLCWDKAEILEKIQYEKVAFPYSIQELMEMTKQKKLERQAKINEKQEDMTKKLSKLETWKQELAAKIHKKEADAFAAKARKDKLIEDVRRHFGYHIDPKDEKFKEALEAKEKEQKKAMKEAKKKLKEERAINDLMGKKSTPKTEENVKE